MREILYRASQTAKRTILKNCYNYKKLEPDFFGQSIPMCFPSIVPMQCSKVTQLFKIVSNMCPLIFCGRCSHIYWRKHKLPLKYYLRLPVQRKNCNTGLTVTCLQRGNGEYLLNVLPQLLLLSVVYPSL